MNSKGPRQWVHLETGQLDAYTNMAVDEVLLNRMRPSGASPVLRFYTWSSPAISVGYFQDAKKDLDLDLCAARGWPVVRRLTGGRAVFHGRDLCYSVLLPAEFSREKKSLLQGYEYLSRGLLAGLRELGVHAELITFRGKVRKPVGRSQTSADCFSSRSWYEIAVEGRKIVGSAQRRTPFGILQQGSILISGRDESLFQEVFRRRRTGWNSPNPGNRRPDLISLSEVLPKQVSLAEVKAFIIQGFRMALGVVFDKEVLSPEDGAAARDLVACRYGTKEWNLCGKPHVFKRENP